MSEAPFVVRSGDVFFGTFVGSVWSIPAPISTAFCFHFDHFLDRFGMFFSGIGPASILHQFWTDSWLPKNDFNVIPFAKTHNLKVSLYTRFPDLFGVSFGDMFDHVGIISSTFSPSIRSSIRPSYFFRILLAFRPENRAREGAETDPKSIPNSSCSTRGSLWAYRGRLGWILTSFWMPFGGFSGPFCIVFRAVQLFSICFRVPQWIQNPSSIASILRRCFGRLTAPF